MNPPPDPTDLQKTVLEAQEDLATTLRAIAHKKRLEVLALLLTGPQEFNELLTATRISKTALAKHLTLLLDKMLINRRERGIYQLTSDGQEVLSAIVHAYKRSEARALSIRKQLWSQYLPDPTPQAPIDAESFWVETKARCAPGWQTFVMATTGILNSLGLPIDAIDVSGYLGQAFHINVAKGLTCPTSPTRHNAWRYFFEGISTLGWEIQEQFNLGSYPGEDAGENQERALKFFGLVKQTLHRTKRPVILWGIPVPEYGIVNGYFEDKYDVSTFLSSGNNVLGPERPIRYDQLKAPTRLVVFSFEKRVAIPKNKDLLAIKRISAILAGKNPRAGYIVGLDAFDEWARVLNGNLEYISYHGNSYVGEFTLEQTYYGQTFLHRLSQKYRGTAQGKSLVEAHQAYQRIHENMKQFQALFPFAFDGDLTLEKRKNGATLLHLNTSLLKRVLMALQTAYDVWEQK